MEVLKDRKYTPDIAERIITDEGENYREFNIFLNYPVPATEGTVEYLTRKLEVLYPGELSARQKRERIEGDIMITNTLVMDQDDYIWEKYTYKDYHDRNYISTAERINELMTRRLETWFNYKTVPLELESLLPQLDFMDRYAKRFGHPRAKDHSGLIKLARARLATIYAQVRRLIGLRGSNTTGRGPKLGRYNPPTDAFLYNAIYAAHGIKDPPQTKLPGPYTELPEEYKACIAGVRGLENAAARAIQDGVWDWEIADLLRDFYIPAYEGEHQRELEASLKSVLQGRFPNDLRVYPPTEYPEWTWEELRPCLISMIIHHTTGYRLEDLADYIKARDDETHENDQSDDEEGEQEPPDEKGMEHPENSNENQPDNEKKDPPTGDKNRSTDPQQSKQDRTQDTNRGETDKEAKRAKQAEQHLQQKCRIPIHTWADFYWIPHRIIQALKNFVNARTSCKDTAEGTQIKILAEPDGVEYAHARIQRVLDIAYTLLGLNELKTEEFPGTLGPKEIFEGCFKARYHAAHHRFGVTTYPTFENREARGAPMKFWPLPKGVGSLQTALKLAVQEGVWNAKTADACAYKLLEEPRANIRANQILDQILAGSYISGSPKELEQRIVTLLTFQDYDKATRLEHLAQYIEQLKGSEKPQHPCPEEWGDPRDPITNPYGVERNLNVKDLHKGSPTWCQEWRYAQPTCTKQWITKCRCKTCQKDTSDINTNIAQPPQTDKRSRKPQIQADPNNRSLSPFIWKRPEKEEMALYEGETDSDDEDWDPQAHPKPTSDTEENLGELRRGPKHREDLRGVPQEGATGCQESDTHVYGFADAIEATPPAIHTGDTAPFPKREMINLSEDNFDNPIERFNQPGLGQALSDRNAGQLTHILGPLAPPQQAKRYLQQLWLARKDKTTRSGYTRHSGPNMWPRIKARRQWLRKLSTMSFAKSDVEKWDTSISYPIFMPLRAEEIALWACREEPTGLVTDPRNKGTMYPRHPSWSPDTMETPPRGRLQNLYNEDNMMRDMISYALGNNHKRTQQMLKLIWNYYQDAMNILHQDAWRPLRSSYDPQEVTTFIQKTLHPERPIWDESTQRVAEGMRQALTRPNLRWELLARNNPAHLARMMARDANDETQYKPEMGTTSPLYWSLPELLASIETDKNHNDNTWTIMERTFENQREHIQIKVNRGCSITEDEWSYFLADYEIIQWAKAPAKENSWLHTTTCASIRARYNQAKRTFGERFWSDDLWEAMYIIEGIAQIAQLLFDSNELCEQEDMEEIYDAIRQKLDLLRATKNPPPIRDDREDRMKKTVFELLFIEKKGWRAFRSQSQRKLDEYWVHTFHQRRLAKAIWAYIAFPSESTLQHVRQGRTGMSPPEHHIQSQPNTLEPLIFPGSMVNTERMANRQFHDSATALIRDIKQEQDKEALRLEEFRLIAKAYRRHLGLPRGENYGSNYLLTDMPLHIWHILASVTDDPLPSQRLYGASNADKSTPEFYAQVVAGLVYAMQYTAEDNPPDGRYIREVLKEMVRVQKDALAMSEGNASPNLLHALPAEVLIDLAEAFAWEDNLLTAHPKIYANFNRDAVQRLAEDPTDTAALDEVANGFRKWKKQLQNPILEHFLQTRPAERDCSTDEEIVERENDTFKEKLNGAKLGASRKEHRDKIDDERQKWRNLYDGFATAYLDRNPIKEDNMVNCFKAIIQQKQNPKNTIAWEENSLLKRFLENRHRLHSTQEKADKAEMENWSPLHINPLYYTDKNTLTRAYRSIPNWLDCGSQGSDDVFHPYETKHSKTDTDDLKLHLDALHMITSIIAEDPHILELDANMRRMVKFQKELEHIIQTENEFEAEYIQTIWEEYTPTNLRLQGSASAYPENPTFLSKVWEVEKKQSEKRFVQTWYKNLVPKTQQDLTWSMIRHLMYGQTITTTEEDYLTVIRAQHWWDQDLWLKYRGFVYRPNRDTALQDKVQLQALIASMDLTQTQYWAKEIQGTWKFPKPQITDEWAVIRFLVTYQTFQEEHLSREAMENLTRLKKARDENNPTPILDYLAARNLQETMAIVKPFMQSSAFSNSTLNQLIQNRVTILPSAPTASKETATTGELKELHQKLQDAAELWRESRDESDDN